MQSVEATPPPIVFSCIFKNVVFTLQAIAWFLAFGDFPQQAVFATLSWRKPCLPLFISPQQPIAYAFRRDENCAMYEAGTTDIYRGRAIGNGPLTNLVHYVHPKSEYTEQARKALAERNEKRPELLRTTG